MDYDRHRHRGLPRPAFPQQRLHPYCGRGLQQNQNLCGQLRFLVRIQPADAADDQGSEQERTEDKIKELQSFIERFSANKSKSRQATSRKKLIEKLTVEEMPASSRRYPYVGFQMDREAGKEILTVEGLSKTVDGVKVLDDVSFRVNKGDKIAFVGENEIANTTLFQDPDGASWSRTRAASNGG